MSENKPSDPGKGIGEALKGLSGDQWTKAVEDAEAKEARRAKFLAQRALKKKKVSGMGEPEPDEPGPL